MIRLPRRLDRAPTPEPRLCLCACGPTSLVPSAQRCASISSALLTSNPPGCSIAKYVTLPSCASNA